MIKISEKMQKANTVKHGVNKIISVHVSPTLPIKKSILFEERKIIKRGATPMRHKARTCS